MLNESILAEAERVSVALCDPDLSDEAVERFYARLRIICEQLKSENERRSAELIVLGKTTMTRETLGQQLRRYGIANLCIILGVTRSEVLGQLGVRE